MSPITGSAIYKKKAGMITVYEEESPPRILWKCIDAGVAPPVEIMLDSVVTLQASRKESPKMLLVIGIGKSPDNKTDVTFAFNSRVTMDNVKTVLQQTIARRKSAAAADASLAASANSDGSGASGTSSPAPMDTHTEEFLSGMLDENNLLKNLTLQQKLLRDNPTLMKTFAEAVIKSGLSPEEFWSTRVHLLRSYAIQTNQKRGPYNVLSTIKPVASSENQVNVSVTREKIHEIFQQYPIVRKAYDDNVPKMSEGEFWSRFFSSKLFRKLRGEKVNLYDRGDITLDKYLFYDPDYDGEEEDADIDKLLEEKKEEDGLRKRRNSEQLTSAKKKVKLFTEQGKEVPKFIDIRANEEDDSGKLGNGPDITMKENQNDELVSVMRSMNRLSRRMMQNIKDNTNTEQEFEQELDLKDLENANTVEYNQLEYTQRSNLSSNILPADLLEKFNSQSPLNPTPAIYDEYIKKLKSELNEVDLTTVYVDNKKPLLDTYKEVLNVIKKNAKSQAWTLNLEATVEKQDVDVDLPRDKLESLRLTHSTSVEFLRHFWLHYNSIGTSSPSTNPNFRAELLQLKKLYTSITKCLERVQANVSQMDEADSKLGKLLMEPLIKSLTSALQSYEAAIVG
ncbi:hypothetical protein OGAPHI_005979 [Ogataea philodendri]|uniref:BSD domain-containing protein n=1 Tax=Ogataea philodendri TaxID=1378263 RepID=A0A9P8T0T3_9ASCO|nr:uncharacterized protein OGAPHI_005979 [Ogataea philodendri]KAH3661801.1 hypothetical protein OGAPHI_005979 [Ogataea philodendri]